MDGKVVISTELETKDFEKQLKQQEKELQKYEQEAEKLTKLKVSIDTNSTKKAIDDLNIKFKEARQKYKDILASGETGIGIGKQKDLVDDLKFKLDETKAKYREQLGEVTKINNQLNKNATAQGVIKNKIQETTGAMRKQQFLGNLKGSLGEGLQDIAGKTENVIRKIGKWALALFGIRAMYSFIRNSINTITQSDAQLKADIDYMKNALAYTLEPVIRQIVGWAQQLMQYLGYIVYKWTGKNIFENANKSLKSATGEAKKLKKELMGFDEVNMLSDTSSGGGGATTPSFDLSKTLSDEAVPKWVKWIADNKKVIEDLGLTALAIFGAGTIANWIKNIGGFLGSEQLGLLGTKLGALGLIAGGIIITKICADYIWNDLKKLHDDLREISDLGQKGQDKWLETEPEINRVFDTWSTNLYSTTEMYQGIESLQWDILSVVDLITGKEDTRLYLAKQQSKLGKKQIDYMVQQYNKGKLTEEQQKRIIDTIRSQIRENNEVIEKLKKQKQDTSEIEAINKDLETQLFAVTKGIQYNEKATDLWKNAQDGVNTEMDGTVEYLDKIQNTKIEDKDLKINPDLTDYYSSMDSIKKSKNTATIEVDAKTDKLKTGIVGAIGSALSSMTLKPIGIAGLGNLAGKSLKKILGLAQGGIVNMPGNGVPIGYNTIAGESGREGVIPLTDPQAMAQLGEEIGRWVNIGIQNQMVVDGRVLASATNNRINKESFLMNR